MLEGDRLLLEGYRQQPDTWWELAHETGHEAFMLRYRVLTALQFDLRPEDHDLVCYLLAQEVERHRGLWGIHPALGLAAYLLATFRDPEDVFPLWDAQGANIDAADVIWNGVLFAAGVDRTLDLLRHTDRPEAGRMLEWLESGGRSVVTQERVDQVWEHLRREYPGDPALAPPQEMLDRALEVGDRGAVERWLAAWVRTGPDRRGDREKLARVHHQLGHLDDAIRHQEAALAAFAREPDSRRNTYLQRQRAEAQLRLAVWRREAGRYDAAWEELRRLAERLTRERGWEWKAEAIGQGILAEAFALAATALPDDPPARQAFDWAEELARLGAWASTEAAGRAQDAAARLGDEEALVRLRGAAPATRPEPPAGERARRSLNARPLATAYNIHGGRSPIAADAAEREAGKICRRGRRWTDANGRRRSS